MIRFARIAVLLCLPALLGAQVLNNASLNGRYHFVHLLVSVSLAGEATNVRNLGGSMTFDGNGGFTFQGQMGSGSGAPAAASGAGVYTVTSSGFVTLSNPIVGSLVINARLGAESEIVVGSSTEATDGSYDLFVAARAPSGGVTNAALSGNYTGGSLWFPNGRDTALKTALVSLSADGQGRFPTGTVTGHAADQNDVGAQQALVNSTYALNGDGSGTAEFGAGASLFGGSRAIFVSANGSYLIGYSTAAGGRDIFLAVKNFSASANDASWNDSYWVAELNIDAERNIYTTAAGAVRSNGQGVALFSERSRVDLTPLDFTGINAYRVNANSTGFLGGFLAPDVTNFVIGAPLGAVQSPGTLVSAEVDVAGLSFPEHGIAFGVRMPALTGGGTFLSPLGVVSGASFSPPTYPISGGSVVSLFGSGLTPASRLASSVPLPTSLEGVSVTIEGRLAPLFSVTTTPNFDQINLQVPFATSGDTATVVVNNNGTASNSVVVPVGASSPGIFSVQQTGIGPGTITHADFRLVTPQNPAAPGETVIIFMTGLGALNPAFPDGAAGPSSPLSRITDPNLQVLFNNEAGSVQFAGAAPTFVGLYQINVVIPNPVVGGNAVPVAISTSNAFADVVDIAIGF